MKRLLLIKVFLLTLFQLSGQTLFPYLQAPQPTSIYVNWKTATISSPVVLYGTSSSNLGSTVTGSQSLFVDGGYSGNYYYNTVQLINLTPNTKYYYTIVSGAESSDTMSFKTLPLPGQAATVDGHLRFMIMGDNQIQTTGRYDTLVAQAKQKVFEKWGGDPSDNIALTFMVGDQVDLGNLSQYENIHFQYNRDLSGYVPIQTTVGNHETYGSMGLNAYYAHFYLNQLTYQGINSGTENYYAMQVGSVLLISLSSEHTGTAQFNWLQQVMTAAETDPTVDWVITFSHRPYEAEQYVGDISQWVKNTAVPFCMESEKYLMHVGAHHHLYARGQFPDKPVYNIISGGTAWDQYWGQSSEQDFACVQKTISNWCYQILDFDLINDKVDIETYSVGSPVLYANNQWKQNELVDEFHRYKNQTAPNQPTFLSNFGDSLELPFEVVSSPFSTTTAELMNSTHFQVAQTTDFSVPEIDLLRDYENLFGQAPGQAADSSNDLNAGVDITKCTFAVGSLQNGVHYIRVRHRDRNLEWSPWSITDTFQVYNSFSSGPYLAMDSTEYHLGAPLKALYTNGPGNSTDWIGLYKLNNVPGPNPSNTWQYCTGASGLMNFSGTALTQSGLYFGAYFELDSYNEIAARDTFYYGLIPVISSDTNSYAIGTNIPIYIANAPNDIDSIEIIKVGYEHGVQAPAFWGSITATNDTVVVSNMQPGYYVANYYFHGEQVIGQPYFFSVGDTITNLWIDQPVYDLGENIVATWTDAPGIVKDWLGIYNQGDNPSVDPLLIYTYFDGVPFGTKTLTDTLIPTAAGEYYIVMFTNDSYTEVSNRVNFSVVDYTGLEELGHGIKVYPNPAGNENVTIISTEYPIEYIRLLDAQGKVVYQTDNVQQQKYSLLSQQLPAGQYIVEVQTRKLFRYKLVIQ